MLGVVLAVEGGGKGMLPHRVFSLVLGLSLAAPFASYLWRGPRAIAAMRRGLLFMLPTALILLLLELGVRLADVETWAWPEQRPHPLLEFQYLPHSGGMDAWGFRNRAVPERAEIVVLGDSTSYGFGVLRSETYPSVLAARTGRSVYNMGIGQYGPVQYYALARRALELRPAVVVIGIFLGNDLLDAHRVGTRTAWRRLHEAGATHPELIALPEGTAVSLFDALRPQRERGYAPRMLFALERSSRAIGWLTTRTRIQLYTSRYLAGIYESEPDAPAFDGDGIATLFAPRHRSQSLELADARVREGLTLTRTALRRTRQLLEAAGVRLVLMPIYTKEHYYQEQLLARGSVPESMARLHALESAAARELERFADGQSLTWLDTRQALRGALAAGEPAFFTNVDVHMAPAGHRALARLLADAQALKP